MERRVEAVCKIYGLRGSNAWRGTEKERQAVATAVGRPEAAAAVEQQGAELQEIFRDIFRGEVMTREACAAGGKRQTVADIVERGDEIVRFGA